MEKFQIYFFGFSFLAVLFLAVLIFLPFLVPVSIAATLAIIFSPLHEKLAKFMGGMRGLAAFITVVLAVLIIIPPLFFIGQKVFQEAVGFSAQLNNGGVQGISQALSSLQERIAANFPGLNLDFNQYFQSITGWFSGNIGTIFTGVAKVTLDFLLNIFIGSIAFYYFLKDGKDLIKVIVELSPLPDKNDYEILSKVEKAINSVIRGSLVISLVQGFLVWLGLTIFGVPNAALLGSVAALTSLIPGVGTSLITIPSIIYLFLAGPVNYAIGLMIWHTIFVGLIDNMLSPMLIRRGMQVHPFFILLSVMGGLLFFGPMGFLLGPVVLSLLFAMIEIYRFLVKSEQKSLQKNIS